MALTPPRSLLSPQLGDHILRTTTAESEVSTPDDLDLLFVEDLARMFKIDLPAVRKRLRLGQFGRFLRVGKRMAVLRSSLRDFLHASQVEVR